MVRVAGLKGQQLQDVDNRSADGLTAGQQLVAITAAADALMRDQQKSSGRTCACLLDEANVHVLRRDGIDDGGVASGWRPISASSSFPVLTPQALDPAHPFPFIPNRGTVADLRSLPPVGQGAGARGRHAARDDAALRPRTRR